jgi:hypothetical protein
MKQINLKSLFVYIFLIAIIAVSCNKDDNNNNNITIEFKLDDYFSVENGTPYNFVYPSTSDTSERPEIDTIIAENQVFPGGGTTTINVKLSEPVIAVVVGIDTSSGYYGISKETASDNFSFEFNFSDEPAKKVYNLYFAAEDEDDFVSATRSIKIVTIEGVLGELEVKCDCDNPVDIDLLLEEPSVEVIYYDNQISENKGYLNRDSNPFCWLDSINSESIIYGDEAAIEVGEYKVMARFLSSCDISDSTEYSVSVLFNDELLDLGSTPNPFTNKLGADETGTEPFDLFTFNINSGLKSTMRNKLYRIVSEDKNESLTPGKKALEFK